MLSLCLLSVYLGAFWNSLHDVYYFIFPTGIIIRDTKTAMYISVPSRRPNLRIRSEPCLALLASLRGTENQVANGQSIPNLGERRCLVGTEGATKVKKMNMQVANVYKGLLNLSRCADMIFEGCFGCIAGAFVCERTCAIICLTRKCNLYVLRV